MELFAIEYVLQMVEHLRKGQHVTKTQVIVFLSVTIKMECIEVRMMLIDKLEGEDYCYPQ